MSGLFRSQTTFFSEADQKKNPSAVVTALKFYAKTVMTQEADKQKFMITNSQLPYDDENDDEPPPSSQPATKADDMGNGNTFICCAVHIMCKMTTVAVMV